MSANAINKTIDTDGTLAANSDANIATQKATKTYADTKVTGNVAITGATKTKITYDTKGLVTAGADATTADIADSTNKRYVTDAQLVVIGNTSGTNTGDQTSVSGNAGTVTIGDAGGDTTTWPLLGTSQTGNLSPSTDGGLTYNATTNALTASSFVGSLTGNADTVTTNANLTGPITSIGNATSIASQTGTGSKFVVDNTPTLITPVLGVATATSINGLGITSSTGTLTITNGKTLSISKTLTLDGTDSTTMTFPSTSATIARTDAANTFTGHQTIEGVTTTGATGSGKLVFDTSPTFTTDLTTPVAKLSGTSNQLIFQSAGVTGTISWAPATSNKTITLSNGSTDFTATGGASKVLQQASAGAAITVAQLAASDLSNGTTGSNSVVLGTSPTIATPTLSLANTSPTAAGGIGYDQTNNNITIGDGSNSQIFHTNAGKSFTPSWTNLTVGNATNTGAYIQQGKQVYFRTYLKWGNTTSIGGAVTLTLPVGVATYIGNTFIGLVRLVSAGAAYVGQINQAGAITVANASATYLQNTALSSTVPGTWTTNDEIEVSAVYEAA